MGDASKTMTVAACGRRSRMRAAAVVAMVAASLLWGSAPTAGADTKAPPIVGIAQALGGGPTMHIYRNCDGEDELYPVESGFLLDRTGDVSSPLTVALAFSGDGVADLVEVPASVTFEAGMSSATVTLNTTAPGPASLSVAVVDGPDYDPGSSNPAYETTKNLDSPPPVVAIDCALPLPVDDSRKDQTIGVGEVPQALNLPFIVVTEFESTAPESDALFTEVVDGQLPPGLTYVDGTWGGAASTPGEYRFRVAACTVANTYIVFVGSTVPIEVCFGSVEVRIVVADPADGTDPGPAPPASPIRAPANLTG